MSFSINELKNLTILNDLPENILSWLAAHGTKTELSADEYMFEKGQAADFMFLIVYGKINRYEEIGGQLIVADIFGSGQVTGMLPYSRMTHYPGPAVAKEDSKVLSIHKKDFPEMLAQSEELGQRLIAEMTNRVRGGVRMEQQLEKMVSLGRLAAGLAHEVNNPAAAINRTASVIKDLFNQQITNNLKIVREKAKANELNVIEDYIGLVREIKKPKLTLLQRSELEEEFSDFFESKSLNTFTDLSSIFVEAGLSLNDIKNLAEKVTANIFGDALTLIAANIEIDNMLTEIINSAKGISELVSSVKIYSHMDQSVEYKPTDIHIGIENTLRMFDYKLKMKNITLLKNYQEDLPSVQGNAGQLNQVWTNIIENALDAMEDRGQLRIETKSNDLGVEVRIIDNGSGIPAEVLGQIFDPFFTTKSIGEGTGLGLEIARRIVHAHHGQIEARSKPGLTEMFILLPLK